MYLVAVGVHQRPDLLDPDAALSVVAPGVDDMPGDGVQRVADLAGAGVAAVRFLVKLFDRAVDLVHEVGRPGMVVEHRLGGNVDESHAALPPSGEGRRKRIPDRHKRRRPPAPTVIRFALRDWRRAIKVSIDPQSSFGLE